MEERSELNPSSAHHYNAIEDLQYGDLELKETDTSVHTGEEVKGCTKACQVLQYLYPLIAVLLLNALVSFGQTLVSPDIPYLMIKYFMQQEGTVKLEGNTTLAFLEYEQAVLHEESQASKQAVQINTIVESTRAAIAFFFVPVYGKLVDTVGRKPFFTINAILCTLPSVFLYAFPENPLWYTAFFQLSKLVTGAYSFAYLCDHYPEKFRGPIFAMTTGINFIASIPAVAFEKIPFHQRLIASLILLCIRVPFSLFGLRESLSADDRKSLGQLNITINPLPVMKLVLKNKYMRALTFLVCLLTISQIGPSNVGQYYLIDKIGLTKSQMFTLTTEISIILPVGLIIIYPILSSIMGAQWILLLCYIFATAQNTGFMLMTEPWHLFYLVLPLSLGTEIGLPAILSLFANTSDEADQEQQGSRLAGLLAIIDIIKALGPIIAGQVFVHIPKNKEWTLYLAAVIILTPGIFLSALWLPSIIRREARLKAESEPVVSDDASKAVKSCNFSEPRWDDAVSLVSDDDNIV